MIYWGVALVVVSFIVYRMYQSEKARDYIIDLAVVRAEEIFGSKEGKAKMLFALQQVREGLPKWLSFFLTDAVLRGLIECALGRFQVAFKGEAQIVEGGEIGFRVNRIFEDRRGELYAEASTDFKGNDRATMGVKYKF